MGGHRPVLLQECIEQLQIDPNGFYVDGTFGGGGHSQAILSKLGTNGRLLAFDKDPGAIKRGLDLSNIHPQLSMVQGSFTQLGTYLDDKGWQGRVSGILLDLGVSSFQLDMAERGFSFQKDGPLDMRMDTQQGITASQWIADAPYEELKSIFWTYGEERLSGRIAKKIVQAREEQPIETTKQLADLISNVYPTHKALKKHPATRVFQAIRIHINDELGDVTRILPICLQALKPGGRLVVISFHSLEDRLVKRFMKTHSTHMVPRGIPLTQSQLPKNDLTNVKGPISPSKEELAENPRSRSAILRVATKG